MKVLHVCNSDMEGGAAIAAYRLHKASRSHGIDSFMLVQKKMRDDREVIQSENSGKLRPYLDMLPLMFYRNKRQSRFSPSWLPGNLVKEINEIKADIVHLHWICNGFISIKDISKIKSPVVWTIHDMWTFTGGCHYSEGCRRFTGSCGKCPLLNSSKENDLSRIVWEKKKKYFDTMDILPATPSKWMHDNMSESSLFNHRRIVHIAGGVDINTFIQLNKKSLKQKFGLSSNKTTLLFGSYGGTEDPRKGYPYLQNALKIIAGKKKQDDYEILVFGSDESKSPVEEGFTVKAAGKIYDEKKLAEVYSAADIFVSPYLEDNLPNTIIESLSCGTPCVAFNTGGVIEIIDHLENGYLAKLRDSEDLVKGIEYVLNSNNFKKLSENARRKAVKNFNIENTFKNYLSVYKEVLIQETNCTLS